MKKFLLSCLLLMGIIYAQAQSCCSRGNNTDFKLLALNEDFKASHEAPLPLEYTPAAN